MKSYCEIRDSKEKLRYDHNHKTGKFRGTLCAICNCGLGFFKDNPKLMKKAANYVEMRK